MSNRRENGGKLPVALDGLVGEFVSRYTDLIGKIFTPRITREERRVLESELVFLAKTIQEGSLPPEFAECMKRHVIRIAAVIGCMKELDEVVYRLLLESGRGEHVPQTYDRASALFVEAQKLGLPERHADVYRGLINGQLFRVKRIRFFK